MHRFIRIAGPLAIAGLIAFGLHAIVTAAAGDRATFRGVPLPPAESVRGAGVQPPSAWLIVGKRAIPATFGSYCYRGTCADMVAPWMMPRVAKASIPPDTNVLVVVATTNVKEIQVRLGPWGRHVQGQSRTLPVSHSHVGRFEVFALGELGRVRDRLLGVSVTFPPATANADPHVVGGDAAYLWRINPVAGSRHTDRSASA